MENVDQLAIPLGLARWLRTAEDTVVIHDHRVSINRDWWARQLRESGFDDTLSSSAISRGDIFGMADAAIDSPEGAITLLWNAVAWGAGRRPRNVKARLAAVAGNREQAGSLLQAAALLSRTDPRAAYETLKPSRYGNAITWLGPAFFTKFLYFAGGGDANHPCCILDDRVVRSLKVAGWLDLNRVGWSPAEYETYCRLVRSWRRMAGAHRNDLIERWLFDTAGSVPDDEDENEFTLDELSSIYYWCWLATVHYPDSTSVKDFQTLEPKIDRLLDGLVFGLPSEEGDTEGTRQLQEVRNATEWVGSHRREIVQVVRDADTRKMAKESLMSTFGIDADLANLCLLMPIWRLTAEELEEL